MIDVMCLKEMSSAFSLFCIDMRVPIFRPLLLCMKNCCHRHFYYLFRSTKSPLLIIKCLIWRFWMSQNSLTHHFLHKHRQFPFLHNDNDDNNVCTKAATYDEKRVIALRISSQEGQITLIILLAIVRSTLKIWSTYSTKLPTYELRGYICNTIIRQNWFIMI